MIVLDTNQLRHAAFPHGPILGMLRKIAETHGRELALPEMVVVEHVAHHRQEVEQALSMARRSLVTLGRAFGQDLSSQIEALSSERAAEVRRAELQSSFRILPTPAGAAEEALSREANRRPPAEQVWVSEDGKPVKARGARDVTIWLTLLDTARSTQDVWFVSQDGDFGNSDFHPALRQEAQDSLGADANRLKLLHGGVDQLLGELAEPAKTPDHLNAMLQGPTVAHAVNIAMKSGELVLRLMPNDARASWLTSSQITLAKLDVKRSKTYLVGNRLWISAHLKCRADVTYYLAWANGQTGELSQQPGSNFIKFETTVLLEVENSKTRSAEVVAMGPVFVQQASNNLSPDSWMSIPYPEWLPAFRTV